MRSFMDPEQYRSRNGWEYSKVNFSLDDIIEAKSSSTWWNEISPVVSNQSFEKKYCYAQCEEGYGNELRRDQLLLMKLKTYKK